MEKNDVKRVLAGLSLATLLAGAAAGGCASSTKDGGNAGTSGTGAKDAAPQTQPATGGGMSGCGGGMGCGGRKK